MAKTTVEKASDPPCPTVDLAGEADSLKLSLALSRVGEREDRVRGHRVG